MELKMIEKGKIHPFPRQPREHFNREKIKELAESIQEQGLLEPIVCRQMNGTFQVIAGQRRWMAYDYLDENEIPSIVWEIKDDVEAMEKSLIENWHRVDLTDVEKEKMLAEIWHTGKYPSVNGMAKRLGIPQKSVDMYIKSKETRDELHVDSTMSSMTIEATRGLEPEERRKIIEKVEKGELPRGGPLRKVVTQLKKAPETVRHAFIEEKIDFKDVEPLIEVGIAQEMEEPLIEELQTRKMEREVEKQSIIELEEQVANGEKDASKKKEIKTKDQQMRDKIQKARDILVYMPPSALRDIRTRDIREEAIKMVKEIEKAAHWMLQAAGEI